MLWLSLLWFIDVAAGQNCCMLSSLGSLHSNFKYCQSKSSRRHFQIGSSWIPLSPVSKYVGAYIVQSNRDLPSTSGKQPRAIAITYTVWGVFSSPLTNNLKREYSCLVLRSLLVYDSQEEYYHPKWDNFIIYIYIYACNLGQYKI